MAAREGTGESEAPGPAVPSRRTAARAAFFAPAQIYSRLPRAPRCIAGKGARFLGTEVPQKPRSKVGGWEPPGPPQPLPGAPRPAGASIPRLPPACTCRSAVSLPRGTLNSRAWRKGEGLGSFSPHTPPPPRGVYQGPGPGNRRSRTPGEASARPLRGGVCVEFCPRRAGGPPGEMAQGENDTRKPRRTWPLFHRTARSGLSPVPSPPSPPPAVRRGGTGKPVVVKPGS